MKNFIKSNMEDIVFFILILFATFAIPMFCEAAEPVDTIGLKTYPSKVVEDVTISAKGNKTVHYYFLINNELIPTTKTVVNKYNLCKKYNAKLALDAVVSKKTRKIKKIILG